MFWGQKFVLCILQSVLLTIREFFFQLLLFPFFPLRSGLTMNNNINSQLNNNAILTNNNNNNTFSSKLDEPLSSDQPDPDYIKMFVGQVPRSMDEAQLKEMFEEFGRVHQINVLRDKVTGLSKGES